MTKMMLTARITLVSITVVWSVLGGTAGFMLNRTIANYDRFMAQYERMSSGVERQKAQVDALQAMLPVIDGMRATISTQSRRIDELEDKITQTDRAAKKR